MPSPGMPMTYQQIRYQKLVGCIAVASYRWL